MRQILDGVLHVHLARASPVAAAQEVGGDPYALCVRHVKPRDDGERRRWSLPCCRSAGRRASRGTRDADPGDALRDCLAKARRWATRLARLVAVMTGRAPLR